MKITKNVKDLLMTPPRQVLMPLFFIIPSLNHDAKLFQLINVSGVALDVRLLDDSAAVAAGLAIDCRGEIVRTARANCRHLAEQLCGAIIAQGLALLGDVNRKFAPTIVALHLFFGSALFENAAGVANE